MRTSAAIVILSIPANLLAQDQPCQTIVYENIRSFAHEASAVLTPGPASSTERMCEHYSWIQERAHDLATELRATRPEEHANMSDWATSYALANYYTCKDPQLAAYYQTTAILALTRSLNSPSPTGCNSLVELSDLARQADRARTVERLARVHRRLEKRMAEFVELMAVR